MKKSERVEWRKMGIQSLYERVCVGLPGANSTSVLSSRHNVNGNQTWRSLQTSSDEHAKNKHAQRSVDVEKDRRPVGDVDRNSPRPNTRMRGPGSGKTANAALMPDDASPTLGRGNAGGWPAAESLAECLANIFNHGVRPVFPNKSDARWTVLFVCRRIGCERVGLHAFYVLADGRESQSIEAPKSAKTIPHRRFTF